MMQQGVGKAITQDIQGHEIDSHLKFEELKQNNE